MARFDKDIHQKEMAIRFCLVNDLIPFLEVNVSNFRELSDTSTIITDIDALGVKVDSAGQPRKVIFDCKTLKSQSPINRAFWASGLMNFTGCNESFIILKRKASEAHRLSAKQIGVHLFDDNQFKNYASSCSVDFNIDYCHSTNINSWIKLEESARGNQPFEKFLNFLCNDIPLEQDCVRGIRKFTIALKNVKGEFDPQKPKHQAIFYYALSIFAYLMAQVVHDLRNVVDFDSDIDAFEKILKYYMWGGRDSFVLRNKLQNAYSAQTDAKAISAGIESELKMNNWNGFIELSRNLLDSPADIQKCINPIREFAFMSINEASPEKSAYATQIISSSNRVRQFTSLMAQYLIGAVDLPKDFMEVIDASFNEATQQGTR
ncbi:hypothetical protein BCU90_17505 [Vibrio lentus]|uniref:hypothetical protein n=1 Tax=Vibrio lentus TaxID=136468 RepID=UPI000C827466|nr:hypothetical protein [Vibrio lentus]PMG45660.1 hypothetical protein BCU90_17505 [Vibrio lentus]